MKKMEKKCCIPITKNLENRDDVKQKKNITTKKNIKPLSE
jgi:hypothetical protein